MEDGLKLERQTDGTYNLTLIDDNKTVVKRGMTLQEAIYELEMRTYCNEHRTAE